jgi:two-component system CheB/CheR fusion protein
MLSALPVDTGMAFVLVQHLSPTRDSQLAEILSRTTAMPVTEVRDEPRVQPNRVYVIPSGRDMIIAKGALQLFPRSEARGAHRPIDLFLRSLAEDQKHRAIGVILSGTATDGTLGLEEIKAEGGITFAQDDSAQQTSMPHSAIATGCVDFVLSPGEIAGELGRIALHPYVAPVAPAASAGDSDLGSILKILLEVTGVDFSQYKKSTLYRRISRRMVLHKLEGLEDYARLLQKENAEAEALYQDILINVTCFFRNPETFEALKEKALTTLFKDRSRQEPLRVWVLGCSTGEEAYSTAIACTEYAEASDSQLRIQVFASDLNAVGIEKARAGAYSKDIVQDVSPERLRRYFVEVDGHYRITKLIRDMCVFARHNVLTDPPFSQIDLICCRNMLIYLEPELQKRIVPLLHYALKPAGFLMLGTSETIGSYRDLFEPVDAKHRIYARKPAARRLTLGHVASFYRGRGEAAAPQGRLPQAGDGADLQKEADRMLWARYVPPAVLVNANLEILQLRGDTGPYLTPASGKASLNLLRMVRDGLLVRLRSAINKVRKEGIPAREEGLLVKADGGIRKVNLEVVPVRAGSGSENGFLVLFEEAGSSRRLAVAETAERETSTELENTRLGQELAAAREYLQSVIEQQETANEELQSANEEAQSANEELQSVNEELETSKEEIQSSNEELVTVNDELQHRNVELHQLNNDLVNLLDNVNMAIVMLGPDLRVRRFTPVAETMLNLVAADLGRSILDLKLTLDVPDLESLLDEVIGSTSSKDREVQDRAGAWYSLRIRPYRTLENKIDGAVIVLVDINAFKKLEEALQLRVNALAVADRSKNEFLALLAHELRNPLAPLRNAVDLMGSLDAGPETVERARSLIGRQVQNMARLIDDLLDVARITEGKVRLRRKPVDLSVVLVAAVDVVRQDIEARGQRLSVSLPRGPVVLDADPTRMEQIFGNLLNNASKFSPKGGHISLAAELAGGEAQPSGQVIVRVRDDGIGMTPATLAHVFDLFMQADRSLDRSRGGLGIGLTLVRRLVELHDGSVTAHSAGQGLGSELVVRLPILSLVDAEPERDRDAGAGMVMEPSVVAVPRRILVVDDNMDSADSLALLLRLQGHEVETVYDGITALERGVSLEPEVVVLDIGLPGLDGYQVARGLRRRPRTAKVLLIALTGYGQEEDQRQAREAGFDHHLVKPVDPQILYDLIDNRSD